MHVVGAPNRRGRRFGQSDVPYLPLTDECRERADTVLDWHLRIHSMQVQQIVCVGAESPKTVAARRDDFVRRSIRVDPRARLRRNYASFGCEHDVAASGAKTTSDERFVVPLTVNG